jgi:hypothetical protein
VRLRYIWQGDTNTLEVSYDAELNDRDDPRVSPDRHRGKGLLRMPLADLWTAELQASWRRSQYDDIVAERTENLWMAGLRITRKLTDSWDLYADYQIGDNDASDDRFSYTRHRAVIGASWLF